MKFVCKKPRASWGGTSRVPLRHILCCSLRRVLGLVCLTETSPAEGAKGVFLLEEHAGKASKKMFISAGTPGTQRSVTPRFSSGWVQGQR